MLTLKEAKKLQKERESKAILFFLLSFALIGIGTFILLEYTTLFELSTVFYLIPIGLLALAVKKTRIYLFLTPRYFEGSVVRSDLYPVKTGVTKGTRTYETRQGIAFEREIFIENGNRLRSIVVPDGLLSVEPSVGTTFALLHFIDEPVIIDSKSNND